MEWLNRETLMGKSKIFKLVWKKYVEKIEIKIDQIMIIIKILKNKY